MPAPCTAVSVLDEATRQLDTLTERRAQEDPSRLRRTRVGSAHFGAATRARWVDSAAGKGRLWRMAAQTSLARSLRGLRNSRPLLPSERSFLEEEFGDSLELGRLRIAGGGHPFGRIAWQPGAALVQFADGCFEASDPGRAIVLPHYPVLAHEALHVWQRVHKLSRLGVSVEGLLLGITRGRAAYAYDTAQLDPAAVLTEFLRGNIEQQGQIFEDYVRSNVIHRRARAAKFERVAQYVRERSRLDGGLPGAGSGLG